MARCYAGLDIPALRREPLRPRQRPPLPTDDRLRSCLLKTPYKRRVTAERAVDYLWQTWTTLTAYKCRYGDHWHIGNER